MTINNCDKQMFMENEEREQLRRMRNFLNEVYMYIVAQEIKMNREEYDKLTIVTNNVYEKQKR